MERLNTLANPPIFITGIGTGIGKTVVSAIVTEALQADYWKPMQAGYEDGADRDVVQQGLSNQHSFIHHEKYALSVPASPHIAAKHDGVTVTVESLVQAMPTTNNKHLVIEGAGGILVPINEQEFIADLIVALQAKVILVSRNYLGSINHSLLTAAYCKHRGIPVLGWIFNDEFMQYEDEVVAWSGWPKLLSVPKLKQIDAASLYPLAQQLKATLTPLL